MVRLWNFWPASTVRPSMCEFTHCDDGAMGKSIRGTAITVSINSYNRSSPQNPYSRAGLDTRIFLRRESSWTHSAMVSSSLPSSGKDFLKEGCGQLLAHTMRSGAAFISSFAMRALSVYMGGPLFEP